ncbi:MAG: hypothetical protein AB1782_07915 [Cyanobacteriota bacterium]
MLKRLFAFVWVLTLLLVFSTTVLATTISNYDASFELTPDSKGKFNDCHVVLEITYDIDEPKQSGFKFVGDHKPVNVEVYDQYERDLNFSVSEKEEYLISYDFPEKITSGEYTVYLEFDQYNIPTGNSKMNKVKERWVGNFKYDVKKATYSFIFPEGYKFKAIKTFPGGYNLKNENYKQWKVSINQNILKNKKFEIEYSPGLISRQDSSSSFIDTIFNPANIKYIFIVGFVVLLRPPKV